MTELSHLNWGLVLGAAQVVALIAVGVALMAALRAFRRAQAAADDATTQAHRAAEASELRAQAAERALAESARPWVTAEALTLLRPEVWRQGRLDARLELLVRNSGPSPADNLRVTLTPAPSPDAATTDAFRHEGVAFFDARPRAVAQAWPDVFNDAPQALPLSVAPGQGVVQAVRLSSPEVTLKDIVPGGLLVFGRLDYADAQGRAHVTRFAFQLMNRDGAWRFDPRPALGALD